MVDVRGQESARGKLGFARGLWTRPAPVERDTASPRGANGVSVETVTVAELFSGDFRFRLTCFQRAYAWREENAARLVRSMLAAMRHDDPKKRKLLLGRLVLAQPAGQLETEVVDGHQRLLTLTIIFAVLRDLETDPARKSWLHGFVAGGAHHPQGTPVWRLTAQATLSRFFEDHVQQLGATDIERGVDLDYLSESERNILENLNRIQTDLTADGITAAMRRELQDFITQSCRVFINLFPDETEAWDYIRTEQETQLEFTPADQAKAVLLSTMPHEERIPCSRLWEDCEAILSQEDMYRVLGHIRAMEWRGRSSSPTNVEQELIEHFGLEHGGFAFMQDMLVPSAELLSMLRRGIVGDELPHLSPVVRSLEYLSWMDRHSWVPAALQWLRTHGDQAPEMPLFFMRLERLVWVMKISGMDPSMFERRVLTLIEEIRAGLAVEAMSKLEIERERLDAALTNLRSPGYGGKRHQAGLVLRRLSIAMGKDCGPVGREGRGGVTIEHILPQRPSTVSSWRKHFRTEADVKAYAQRLGNLTLLSSAHNQRAGTYDWPAKRQVLCESPIIMSREVAKSPEWMIKSIANRTEDMIAQLFALWDIEV